jgi:hypothetical protein
VTKQSETRPLLAGLRAEAVTSPSTSKDHDDENGNDHDHADGRGWALRLAPAENVSLDANELARWPRATHVTARRAAG